jgi:hypothetical protein
MLSILIDVENDRLLQQHSIGPCIKIKRPKGGPWRVPPPISGVAIMTDTDNTGESATAHYGDIVFKQACD